MHLGLGAASARNALRERKRAEGEEKLRIRLEPIGVVVKKERAKDRERGCDRWRKGDRGRGRRVDPPSVLSPIILSSRVSLTNVARSSDPSAIHDDARDARPGGGRASSTTKEPRHLSHDQRAVRTCVCVCVCVCYPDMRLSNEDSRRNDGSRETTDFV